MPVSPQRYPVIKDGLRRTATATAVRSLYTRCTRGSGAAVLALALVLLWAVLTAGCNKGQHEGNGGNAQAAGSANVRRAPSQPPVPVAVKTAGRGAIASYYSATATLTAEKEAEILARTTGVVEELFCEEGDVVTSGQRLLQIEDSEYELRVEQEAANVAGLRDRHDRLKNMLEQNLVSPEEYEAVRNQLAAAEAAEGLARLNLSYTTVTAPFDGRIVERLVDQGQNVSAGTPLFRISDFHPLLAVVHVPSKEFKKLQVDQPVDLVLDSNQEHVKGRIKLVSPVIDPNSGTIKVTIEIPEYPKGTRPGDFAEVSIVTERRADRTLVPKIAVFMDQGEQVVYVAADSTAERRIVEVGFEDSENAEIVSGVADGDRIIVKGQRSLKHGAPIKILEETPAPALTEQAGGQ
jgi:membrane fusion protein (multidrug efflux system)